MTHEKHHTEAIVLSGTSVEEANKIFYLLTKDFGLIVAHARSIRAMSSKLRYSLTDFSHIRADVVLGKTGWRLASAEAVSHFLYARDEKERDVIFSVLARISHLLRRLLKGEEKNECLFDDIVRGFFLLSSREVSIHEMETLEVILVMRILNHLGYWGEDAFLSPFLIGDINSARIQEIRNEKSRAIIAINKALKETQL